MLDLPDVSLHLSCYLSYLPIYSSHVFLSLIFYLSSECRHYSDRPGEACEEKSEEAQQSAAANEETRCVR